MLYIKSDGLKAMCLGILWILSGCAHPRVLAQKIVLSDQTNGRSISSLDSVITTSPDLNTEELSILNRLNILRSSLNLRPVVLESALQKAARLHTDFMNANDSLSHEEPAPNQNSWDRVVNQGGHFIAMGENVACGHSSGEDTFQQWYKSPAHYANMTNPEYKAVGIARAGVPEDEDKKTCAYYWTVDFGG